MNRSHPHPDFHAEALALVGDDMPRVVAVSWALADAAQNGMARAGLLLMRMAEAVSNGTAGIPEHMRSVIVSAYAGASTSILGIPLGKDSLN